MLVVRRDKSKKGERRMEEGRSNGFLRIEDKKAGERK